MGKSIQELMSTNPVAIDADQSFADAAEMLRDEASVSPRSSMRTD
jgi:hypothetical protein